MKKPLRVLCVLLALLAAFLAGWRAMPRVWPELKKAVVYPVFPHLAPTAAPTAVPYTPRSTAAFGEEVAPTDSLVYYFYKDYCPWCRQLEPLMAALPGEIPLPDGTMSAVKLVCLNKVEEQALKIITAYCDAHDVPEERRFVPAVVVGDRYLFAGEEIIDGLLDALLAGEGLRTPLLDGNERR